jgi:hypothetical protein
MKTGFTIICLTVLLCLLSGCASVKFYSGSGLTGKTGLRFYTVKPYLLVEFNAEKDNTVKTSVVYLPDVANPQYLILKPGIGSSELKLAFTNGSLNSYGLVSESQIPETINAIAGLVSKSSDAVAPFTKAEGIVRQAASDINFKLYEIVIGTDGTTLKEVTDVLK